MDVGKQGATIHACERACTLSKGFIGHLVLGVILFGDTLFKRLSLFLGR